MRLDAQAVGWLNRRIQNDHGRPARLREHGTPMRREAIPSEKWLDRYGKL